MSESIEKCVGGLRRLLFLLGRDLEDRAVELGNRSDDAKPWLRGELVDIPIPRPGSDRFNIECDLGALSDCRAGNGLRIISTDRDDGPWFNAFGYGSRDGETCPCCLAYVEGEGTLRGSTKGSEGDNCSSKRPCWRWT